MKIVTSMTTVTAAIMGVVATAQAGPMFGVDFAGNFYFVKVQTGEAAKVGPTGFNRLNSAAMSPSGEIYASRVLDTLVPGDTHQLIKINKDGVGTLVADLGTIGDLRGMAFTSTGVLYALANGAGDNDVLVTVNLQTGGLTKIGSTELKGLQGLTSAPGDKLYAVEVPTGALYEISINNGQPTPVPGIAGLDNQTIEFLSENTLVCARSGVVIVDISTGVSTPIGPLVSTNDMRGLAGYQPAAGPCYADCDFDGNLTIDDFICYQTLFALSDPGADCDLDGSLTIDDFICFQTLFAIGC